MYFKSKVMFFIAIFMLLAGGFLFTHEALAGSFIYPSLYLFTDHTQNYPNQITSSQTITITAVAVATGSGEPVDSIEILVDGQPSFSCDKAYVCRKTYGPFSISESSKAFKYTVKANDKGHITTKNEKFIVVRNDIAPKVSWKFKSYDLAPSGYPTNYKGISSDKPEITVGKGLAIDVFITGETEVVKLTVSIDGKESKICNNYPWICTVSVGLLKDTDVGEHNFQVVALGTNNLSTTSTGKFLVVNPNANKLIVKIKTDKAHYDVDEVIHVTSNATNNSAIKKINIYYDSILKATCTDKSECTLDLGPFPNQKVLGIFDFYAEAFDSIGNKAFSDEITVDMWVQHPKTPNSPSLNVVTDKNSYNKDEKITFTAKSPAKVKKMNILVNARIVKECADTDTCEYVGGPYPKYVGTSVSFGSNTYDSVGKRTWTGYKAVSIKK